MVRRRERDVELEPAGLDLLHEVLGADLVGARRCSASWAFSPWAKTATRTTLPVPFGQDDRATDHLVGMAGVDAQAEVGLDRRVERDLRGVLDELRPPRPGV